MLAEDIGEALGCGAHLAALRRTATGRLPLDDAVTLDALEATGRRPTAMPLLLPVDALLADLPAAGRCGAAPRRSAGRFRAAAGGAAVPAPEPAADGACASARAGSVLLGVDESWLRPVRLVRGRAGSAPVEPPDWPLSA